MFTWLLKDSNSFDRYLDSWILVILIDGYFTPKFTLQPFTCSSKHITLFAIAEISLVHNKHSQAVVAAEQKLPPKLLQLQVLQSTPHTWECGTRWKIFGGLPFHLAISFGY